MAGTVDDWKEWKRTHGITEEIGPDRLRVAEGLNGAGRTGKRYCRCVQVVDLAVAPDRARRVRRLLLGVRAVRRHPPAVRARTPSCRAPASRIALRVRGGRSPGGRHGDARLPRAALHRHGR